MIGPYILADSRCGLKKHHALGDEISQSPHMNRDITGPEKKSQALILQVFLLHAYKLFIIIFQIFFKLQDEFLGALPVELH